MNKINKNVDVLRFIELYRSHEVLWNMNLSSYRRNDLKLKAYELISAEMTMSVEEVKKKIKSLRTAYSAEKSKVERSKKSGCSTENMYMPTVFWYNEMAFLNTSIIRRATIDNSNQCLVKFTRCPVTIETNSNPLRSGAGQLPYLEIGRNKFVGYSQIKKLLDKEGYPVDAKLNPKDKCLSESFSSWVFSNLHAYYHYFMFGEPNNFEITRSFYAKRTPFPFNFYYPSSYQKEAYDIVYTMGGFDIDDKLELHGGDYLTNVAKKCINILSKRLGRKVWFFGDQFSEFDAIVFSYLSILSKITLPNNPIQNHIKGCQNLVYFINRISRDVFKKESFNSINTSKDDASPNNPLLTATERKFLETEKKTKILAGVAAVVAMSSFAAIKIFFKKRFSNSQQYYDGLNYDEDDEFEEDDMD